MIQLPTNQTNAGRLLQNNVASTVWSPYICSKRSVIGRQTRNRNGVAVKWGVWMKQNIVVYVSGYGDLYGSAEGAPRVVENQNLLCHPDDLREEAYVIRMT